MPIFKERILFILLALGALLFIASFLVLIFQAGGFVDPIVLHFDGTQGIDLYGHKIDVWVIWITSLFIFALNTALSNVLYARERVLSYVFVGFNLLFAILTLIFAGVVTSTN